MRLGRLEEELGEDGVLRGEGRVRVRATRAWVFGVVGCHLMRRLCLFVCSSSIHAAASSFEHLAIYNNILFC